MATAHEDVDEYPTSPLDLSKNMSGQIVCTMLNIPPQVVSDPPQDDDDDSETGRDFTAQVV